MTNDKAFRASVTIIFPKVIMDDLTSNKKYL